MKPPFSALWEKTLREAWLMLLIAALAILVFATLLSGVLPQFKEGISDLVVQVPFLRAIVSSSFGIDLTGGLTVSMILTVVWSHPVMLATTWAVGVVLGTRFPAGEIDRGTIDVLLGWPVSRRCVYLAESLMSLGVGVVLTLCLFAGYCLGLLNLAPADRPALGPIILVALNMVCVYAIVSALACVIGALSDRRGRAFGVIFGIIIVSYLLNFIAGIWEPAQAISFLSHMTYYKPPDIVRTGAIAPHHPIVLLSAALLMWTAGLEITARRSITTT
jgi:ABC-type transport system involved in multi-copper enzyme maturation permease subunit